MSGRDQRRAGIEHLWTAGDYAQLGSRFEPVGQELVAELDVRDRDVVDAATGTGTTAFAAHAAGARVAAFDLTPRLLELARQRAARVGALIDWRLGDLLAAPFADGCADVVTSTFGAFTVDDQRGCAAELVRLCRPGGTIALTAWHRDGFFGELTRVLRERHADLVDAAGPDVHAWAEDDGLATILAGLPVTVTTELRELPLRFPTLTHAMELFERVSGPVIAMRGAVEERGGDWPATRAAVLDAAGPFTTAVDGGVEVRASYTRALVRRDADA